MLLVGNGPLVTRSSEQAWYNPGGLIIEGKEIIALGSWQEMKDYYHHHRQDSPSVNEVIDVAGQLIMPGLINAHHHIYSAYARGLGYAKGPTAEFLDILKNRWWHIDEHLQKEQIYYSGLVTYIESIKNGVTTVIDHHASYGQIKGSLSLLKDAAKACGVRTCLSYEISDRHGPQKTEEAIEESETFLTSLGSEDPEMIQSKVGLHASFTLSDATLRHLQKDHLLKYGYHVHVAEGAQDVLHCERIHGMGVVERLHKQQILGPDTLAIHGIHISPSERELLKETGTMMVHNPESNMANGVGSAEVIKLLSEGITLGLGTDGYTSDMWESLKVANLLQKHKHRRGDVGMSEALDMLFKHNTTIAQSVFGVPVGRLEVGAVADLICVAYNPPTPLNEETIDGHLLFGLQGAMTQTTIINGQVLMRNRRLLHLDESEIYAASRQSADQLWSDLYGGSDDPTGL